MATVRCKFKVMGIHVYAGCEEVSLYCDMNPHDCEGHPWFAPEPVDGMLRFAITNPDSFGKFRPDQEYYLDLTPVEAGA